MPFRNISSIRRHCVARTRMHGSKGRVGRVKPGQGVNEAYIFPLSRRKSYMRPPVFIALSNRDATPPYTGKNHCWWQLSTMYHYSQSGCCSRLLPSFAPGAMTAKSGGVEILQSMSQQTCRRFQSPSPFDRPQEADLPARVGADSDVEKEQTFFPMLASRPGSREESKSRICRD